MNNKNVDMDVNQYVCTGTVTGNPRILKNGEIVSFFMNVDRGNKSFTPRVSVFGPVAVELAQKLKLGHHVLVSGYLVSESYEQDDGTRVFGTNMICRELTRLGNTKRLSGDQRNDQLPGFEQGECL